MGLHLRAIWLYGGSVIIVIQVLFAGSCYGISARVEEVRESKEVEWGPPRFCGGITQEMPRDVTTSGPELIGANRQSQPDREESLRTAMLLKPSMSSDEIRRLLGTDCRIFSSGGVSVFHSDRLGINVVQSGYQFEVSVRDGTVILKMEGGVRVSESRPGDG